MYKIVKKTESMSDILPLTINRMTSLSTIHEQGKSKFDTIYNEVKIYKNIYSVIIKCKMIYIILYYNCYNNFFFNSCKLQ